MTANKNSSPATFFSSDSLIAALAIVGIAIHFALLWGGASLVVQNGPLQIVLLVGGLPLVWELAQSLYRRQMGADFLAGISIVTAACLGEYLAGAFVVLMLSGGEAIEAYAISSASSVLSALAKRMPSVAHRQTGGAMIDCAVGEIAVDDEIVVFPHEICPVDGVVTSGHGSMDESFLTGEPYRLSKTPGATVISGAINGDAALTIRATKRSVDSRYASIMKVMQQSEEHRPRLRRLGDELGAWYTPLAVGVALLAWLASGQATRFLAVLVVATPCPLLIAIPVAIIGAISLSARHGIIVKKPVVLEQIGQCRTVIFDKTGTLTYGRPNLVEQWTAPGQDQADVLRIVASVEQYSKHPLASAILDRAQKEKITLLPADQVAELPGRGLVGKVEGREIEITSRAKWLANHATIELPEMAAGLECLIVLQGEVAALYRFRDEPRGDGAPFVRHLRPKHHIDRVLIVSGDRESEVRYLAQQVGITDVLAQRSPEEKLAIVRHEMERAKTIFVGDGINDAPALAMATVGLAFGQASDITTEAADAVIMDSSLRKVDQFLHIGERMRTIALQSAIGGMALSLVGMLLASCGYLPPVAGAIFQEAIDVLAVLNATRVAWSPRSLTDF